MTKDYIKLRNVSAVLLALLLCLNAWRQHSIVIQREAAITGLCHELTMIYLTASTAKKPFVDRDVATFSRRLYGVWFIYWANDLHKKTNSSTAQFQNILNANIALTRDTLLINNTVTNEVVGNPLSFPKKTMDLKEQTKLQWKANVIPERLLTSNEKYAEAAQEFAAWLNALKYD